MHTSRLTSDDVEWVVNDLAELGVKIGDQFFFLYKGTSLVYGELDPDPSIPPTHEEDNPNVGYRAGDRMMWRPVFKREFGECCHPINHDHPAYSGTVRLDDCDEWKPLPAARSGETRAVNAYPALVEALEPFAAINFDEDEDAADALTREDFRRARAALALSARGDGS